MRDLCFLVILALLCILSAIPLITLNVTKVRRCLEIVRYKSNSLEMFISETEELVVERIKPDPRIFELLKESSKVLAGGTFSSSAGYLALKILKRIREVRRGRPRDYRFKISFVINLDSTLLF